MKAFPAAAIETSMDNGKQWPCQFSITVSDLITVAERFARYLGPNTKKEDWVLAIIGKAGHSEIRFESVVTQGTFSDRTKVVKPLTSDFRVNWPLDQLLPLLKYLSAQQGPINLHVRFTDNWKEVDIEGKKRVLGSPYLVTAERMQLLLTRPSQ